jgi:hypothetical protein
MCDIHAGLCSCRHSPNSARALSPCRPFWWRKTLTALCGLLHLVQGYTLQDTSFPIWLQHWITALHRSPLCFPDTMLWTASSCGLLFISLGLWHCKPTSSPMGTPSFAYSDSSFLCWATFLFLKPQKGHLLCMNPPKWLFNEQFWRGRRENWNCI